MVRMIMQLLSDKLSEWVIPNQSMLNTPYIRVNLAVIAPLELSYEEIQAEMQNAVEGLDWDVSWHPKKDVDRYMQRKGDHTKPCCGALYERDWQHGCWKVTLLLKDKAYLSKIKRLIDPVQP